MIPPSLSGLSIRNPWKFPKKEKHLAVLTIPETVASMPVTKMAKVTPPTKQAQKVTPQPAIRGSWISSRDMPVESESVAGNIQHNQRSSQGIQQTKTMPLRQDRPQDVNDFQTRESVPNLINLQPDPMPIPKDLPPDPPYIPGDLPPKPDFIPRDLPSDSRFIARDIAPSMGPEPTPGAVLVADNNVYEGYKPGEYDSRNIL